MKLAFDGKRFFHNSSGLGNYSRDLVRILAENFPEHQYELIEQKTSERAKNLFLYDQINFLQAPSGKLVRQFQFGKIAQNSGADIYHGLSGELPLKWTQKSIKKVVTIHDLIFLRFPQFYSFFDRKIHFWKFKNACEQADLVIAISEQTKSDIIYFLKIDPKKIVVVYQGCHPTFKEKKSVDFIQNTREKFNLPEKFILNVGTIEPRKNLLNIVKSLTGTNIPLVVIGKKTGYFKEVKKYIEKNQLQRQIYFLEHVSMPELSVIYQTSELFVYPSLFEGFGIPIIEALFSKTPVITANTSSLPEAGGPNSLYVQPENVSDLRSKIIFLWQNKAERERVVELSWNFVQKFSDEQIAKNVMTNYQSLI